MADTPDFAGLRQEAIAHAQAASGKLWTDFNLHDPGVTLMEQYCFAVTELGYRAEFPVADYLSEEDGKVNLKKLGLHQPTDVLPSRPVTAEDLALILTDASPAARRVIVEPRGKPEKQIEGSDTHDMRGLHDIFVVPERPAEDGKSQETEALRQVRSAFHANRNLCEDMALLQIATPIDCHLIAEIEVQRRHSPERIAALIFETCGRLMTDGDRTNTMDRVSLQEAFDAPEKLFGYDGKIPEGCQLLDHFFAALSKIEEIKNVQSLSFELVTHADEGDPDPFHKPLEKGQYRLLNIPETSAQNGLTLCSRGLKMQFDLVEMRKELVRARAERRGRRLVHTTKSEWTREPKGQTRDFGHVRVGETLPGVYRVGHDVPTYGLSTEEMDAAAQLRSYLGFSDTPLSNQSADFAALKELFAADQGRGRSYQAQAPDYGAANMRTPARIDHVADSVAEFDPWRDRKGRALDHLLGLYGEAFYQNSLRNHDFYRGPLERQNQVLRNRARFLNNIHKLDTDRSGGVDYTISTSCQTAGFGRKLSMLLGFRTRRHSTLTSAVDRLNLTIRNDDDVPSFKEDQMLVLDTKDPKWLLREGLAEPEDIFSMLVPRVESFPAVDHSKLLSKISFLKSKSIPACAFRSAARLSSYVLNGDDQSGWDVFLDLGDDKPLLNVHQCSTQQEAVETANQIAGMFADLNEASEGFFILEDALFRGENNEFDPLTLRVAFSGWTARTATRAFRELAAETISIICPAHLRHRILWLDLDQTRKLQRLHLAWRLAFRDRDVSKTDDRIAELDRMGSELRAFIQEIEKAEIEAEAEAARLAAEDEIVARKKARQQKAVRAKLREASVV